MEFMLDTANIAEIKKYVDMIPVSGVTSNPSIIKKEGKIDFFKHMNEIREIIGQERSLHIQVVQTDYKGVLADAHAITEKVDQNVFIKIPVNESGIKAIKELKAQGKNVTATAIYTKFQAYLAIAAGADYIAPYFNRMENQNIDAQLAIQEMVNEITRIKSSTKVLAASFKNVRQVNAALEAGAQAATMGTDIIKLALDMPSINQAVVDFTADWESVYGSGVPLTDL